MFIFGSIFKGGGTVSFSVALVNESDSAIAQQFVQEATKSKVLKVNTKVTSLEEAKEKWKIKPIISLIVFKHFLDAFDFIYLFEQIA